MRFVICKYTFENIVSPKCRRISQNKNHKNRATRWTNVVNDLRITILLQKLIIDDKKCSIKPFLRRRSRLCISNCNTGSQNFTGKSHVSMFEKLIISGPMKRVARFPRITLLSIMRLVEGAAVREAETHASLTFIFTCCF